MDFVRPIQAVIPGAQGRILAVLAETTAELNLRSIARLSGVSLAQASRLMPSLIELGIVERREAPPSALFRFVPDNVAARVVTSLSHARQTLLDEMTRRARDLVRPPTSVIVFGSFARGGADSKSDIDVVVVRPRVVDEEDLTWRRGLDEWRSDVARAAGNRVELGEVGEAEVLALLHGREPLWADVQRYGVVVFGSSLVDLKRRRSA